MIETIYQPPIMCYSKVTPELDQVMAAFKNTTMYATMYKPYEAPKDNIAVEEATSWLAMETTIEYKPYHANLFNSDEVKQATEWIEEVSSPKTETKREKYLKYQREYYKKNAEKRKAEMMRNYYIKKITM